MVYTVPHYINGEKVQSSGTKQDIYNPALGEVIGYVHFANEDICNQVIDSAKKALPLWSQVSPIKKANILFKFRALLEKNHDLLARLVSEEHGKTIEDARGSVARGIELVEHHCGLMSQMQGVYSANVATQIDCYTLRQPIGVCVGVSPFNFPVMVPIWMIVPAIACGNTFILKPSEQNPSASIKVMELLSEAGLPPGVANCIQGDRTTVDYLLKHPDIQACTAVASTPVAEHIYKTAIANNKRAILLVEQKIIVLFCLTPIWHKPRLRLLVRHLALQERDVWLFSYRFGTREW